eukprot:2061778-Prymnesium_polylepis.1
MVAAVGCTPDEVERVAARCVSIMSACAHEQRDRRLCLLFPVHHQNCRRERPEFTPRKSSSVLPPRIEYLGVLRQACDRTGSLRE